MVDQRELHGGSFHWWPPVKDHVILFRANPLRLDYFESFIGSWAGIKVLDVGCGGGYACEHLAHRRAVVFGTDIMEESLQEANRHAVENSLRIEYRRCSPTHLPYEDNVMDVVTCFDVLEHIPDKQTTLREIYRVLKPGGWLCFDTINKTLLSKAVVIWLGEVLLRFIPQGTHGWSLFVSPFDLQRFLEGCGFTQVRSAGIQSDLRRRNEGRLPVRISPRGNKAIMYFGVATKPIHRGKDAKVSSV